MKNLPFISSEFFCCSFWNNNFSWPIQIAVLQVLLEKLFFRIFPEELCGWCFFLTSNLNSEKKICAQGFRPGVQCVTVDDFDKRLNSSRLWRPLAVRLGTAVINFLSQLCILIFFYSFYYRVVGNILNLGWTQLNLIENWN